MSFSASVRKLKKFDSYDLILLKILEPKLVGLRPNMALLK